MCPCVFIDTELVCTVTPFCITFAPSFNFAALTASAASSHCHAPLFHMSYCMLGSSGPALISVKPHR